jgi:hypothetical protein
LYTRDAAYYCISLLQAVYGNPEAEEDQRCTSSALIQFGGVERHREGTNALPISRYVPSAVARLSYSVGCRGALARKIIGFAHNDV